MMVNAHGRQGGGGAMERERVIVEILAVGVMNHGPSTVERLNWEFASWDFRGEISPLDETRNRTSNTVHSSANNF